LFSYYQLKCLQTATRAYRQALNTLSTLTAQLPQHTPEASFNPYQSQNTPLLASFLPSIHGYGPVASVLRIAQRLRQKSWLPKALGGKNERNGGSRRRDDDLSGKAIKVIDLLSHSAELGHTDALFMLAKISLLPPSLHFPSDPGLAYSSFKEHAQVTGNATSQAYLGFFHATGYRQVVPVDQAHAQLYYTFAAHGGHGGAQMALGYRAWAGIGTPQDCERAVEWYAEAAEQAMAKFQSGPPGGRTLPLTATRLSDLGGGVYGPGASVASTGINSQRAAIKAADARAAGQTWEDILEYYLFNADRGDLEFALRLGKIFYQGSMYASRGGFASGAEGVGAVPRDFVRAKHYFLFVARTFWPKDPQNPLAHQKQGSAPKDGEERPSWASPAAAFLGLMYLRGEGVKQDYNVARMWFERAGEYGEREAHNGLGIIWRDGLTERGKKDLKKAVYHFGIAAGKELAEAQVNLGKIHYSEHVQP
jgi:SEL1 protein